MEYAIFGAAGAIGRALGAQWQRRGIPFRAVGRKRARLVNAFGEAGGVELVTADMGDPTALRAAAEGVATIVYAVGVPYTEFRLHPIFMRNVIDAAIADGVQRLIVVSSVYSYGAPQTARVTETHPREPSTFKGRMRREQEDIALEADRAGRIRTLVLRLPDFYGPDAELSFARTIFDAALAGKPANLLAPIDTPHEWIFVPDVAPVIAELATRDGAFGEAYNLAGPGTITERAFATEIYRAAGASPRWRVVSKTGLRLFGLFNALLRELVEMSYLQETPVILDDAKLRKVLGAIHKTPYADGIRRTVAAMRAARQARAA